MRFRPRLILTLARKDAMRLLRNGPALMLLGLFVAVAFLAGTSGLVDGDSGARAAGSSAKPGDATWIVYWEESEWLEQLERRAPPELRLRFVAAEDIGPGGYPADVCVIELREPRFFKDRQQVRQPVQYLYPGSDPRVLWSVTRWFFSVSLEHFGEMPQFFETIRPLVPPSRSQGTRAALERVTVADLLSLSLLATVILTTVLFFACCGLMVSLTAQERECGAVRALLLTPATFLEFLAAKALVHISLAMAVVGMVMGALLPTVLGSLLFWATILLVCIGYFSVGLLIASFSSNQTAPNLLSFGYLLAIGALNLLGHRFENFQALSSVTFERHGLRLTLFSLNRPELDLSTTLAVFRSPDFRMLFLLSLGLLLISSCVGARRMRSG